MEIPMIFAMLHSPEFNGKSLPGAKVNCHKYEAKLVTDMQLEQRSRWYTHIPFQKFCLGILDYLSRNPVYPGNFPFGQTRQLFPFTFQPKFLELFGKWWTTNAEFIMQLVNYNWFICLCDCSIARQVPWNMAVTKSILTWFAKRAGEARIKFSAIIATTFSALAHGPVMTLFYLNY